MGNTVPAQHPSVVLRSHFQLVRALLVAATIAVVGLSLWVVILANDEDQASRTASSAETLRYGGFNSATGQPQAAPLPQEHPLQSRIGTTRYDGGPEEGTRVVPVPVPTTDSGGAVKDYSMNSATGDSGGDSAQKPERAQQSENGPGARTH
ncbi:MAG TPA: hypothetical protein VF056_12460 [Thermoleophilaceae bacterium]